MIYWRWRINKLWKKALLVYVVACIYCSVFVCMHLLGSLCLLVSLYVYIDQEHQKGFHVCVCVPIWWVCYVCLRSSISIATYFMCVCACTKWVCPLCLHSSIFILNIKEIRNVSLILTAQCCCDTGQHILVIYWPDMECWLSFDWYHQEDGEAEAAAFHAQNIDQILEQRTQQRLIGGLVFSECCTINLVAQVHLCSYIYVMLRTSVWR